jgi:hypothetical protein
VPTSHDLFFDEPLVLECGIFCEQQVPVKGGPANIAAAYQGICVPYIIWTSYKKLVFGFCNDWCLVNVMYRTHLVNFTIRRYSRGSHPRLLRTWSRRNDTPVPSKNGVT